MATVIYPPEWKLDFNPSNPSVFLAGTIDNGAGEDWQQELINEYTAENIRFYNPRRLDWDAAQESKESNPYFKTQVDWELDFIENTDLVAFYFAEGSLSPVSMMELGIVSQTRGNLNIIVYNPDGFWRSGNVDILCQRSGIKVYKDKISWKNALKAAIQRVKE